MAVWDEGMPPVLINRSAWNFRSTGHNRKGLRNWATKAPAKAAISGLLESRMSMGILYRIIDNFGNISFVHPSPSCIGTHFLYTTVAYGKERIPAYTIPGP
jgi:hypothetical protein